MASTGCVSAKSTAACLEWTTVYLVGPSTQEWIQVVPPGSDSLAEPSRVSLGVPGSGRLVHAWGASGSPTFQALDTYTQHP
jgi:hypothetical protein